MNTQPNFTPAETALGGVLPHRRMEAWKWTDVRKTLKGGTGLTLVCEPHFEIPEGVNVSRETILPKTSVMGAIASRFALESIVINVPEGFKSTQVLRISNLEKGHASLCIKLAKGAVLHVEEVHKTSVSGFVNLDMQFDLAQGAKLTRTIFHHDHAETTRIATAHINAWADAEITQHTLSFGAALTRFETRVALLGANIKADIHGAYLLGDKRHVDMTSYIDFSNESAIVRQSVKGVVSDKARGVFQGKFHVRRPAQFTDAEMRHDALMLSDTCEIRAKPELEIYADDVACAHGNTIGALDESSLFYMRQRGIPLGQARSLLTQAFVADAFETMEEGAKEDFLTRISTWLEARL